MSVLKALAQKPIRTIWLGQVLAATGGEFYTVAIVWVSVDLIGSDAGYLAALQSGSYLLGSLFAGLITDRWTHGRTMIGADLARVLLVAALPVAQAFDALSLSLLLFVAAAASIMGAAFDPALLASVPALAPDPIVRRGTNGLFDATRRLARILGPGLIAVLNGLLPVIHFFTVTAAAFLVSALAVFAGTRKLIQAPPRGRGLGIVDSLTAGFRALRGHPVIVYGLVSSVVVNGGWGIGVILGLALLTRETTAEPLAAYGSIISAYGVGNVLANVVISGLRPSRPAWRLTFGRAIFGLGLIGLAMAPNLYTLMLVAAVMAINGPLCDLTLLDLMQGNFPPHLLAPVFRVQSALATGGILISFLLAPTLFQHFTVREVIFGSGVLCTVPGAFGVVYFARLRAAVQRPKRSSAPPALS
jgi:MFS family permease